MNKSITNLRRQVSSIILEEVGLHRCMDGILVDDNSMECLLDIESRIDDASFSRNGHNCGSEMRIYYNGLLKGLRKKRNRLRKIHGDPHE